MLKWLLTLFLATLVLGAAQPWLRRHLRLGQLPGDVVIPWRGRQIFLPFTSTLLSSLLLTLIFRLL